MTNIFYVYLHRRADSGEVFYVGKGKNRRAWNKHGRSELWGRIAAKHGWTVEILAQDMTEETAFHVEIAMIASHSNLCNHTTGGEGISGYAHTSATRATLSAAHKGKPQKPEHVEARTVKLRGRKRTIEFGEAVAARNTGRIATQATRDKMSAARAGRVVSRDTVAKIAQWHTGKTRGAAARANMSAGSAVKRKVYCMDVNMDFDSLVAAAAWLRANGWPKASRSGVWFATSGRQVAAYGFTWAYL